MAQGGGTIIKILAVGVGGWFLATRTNLLCSVGIGASCGAPAPAAPPTTGGPQPGATPGVVTAPIAPAGGAAAPPPAPVSYNTLAAVQARMLSIMAQNNVPTSQGQYTATPWQFNYWLNQVTGYDIGPVIGQLFPGCGTGGACDTGNITFGQFWTVVASWLGTNKGLSGLRGSLGAVAANLKGLGCNRYGCYPMAPSQSVAMARRTA